MSSISKENLFFLPLALYVRLKSDPSFTIDILIGIIATSSTINPAFLSISAYKDNWTAAGFVLLLMWSASSADITLKSNKCICPRSSTTIKSQIPDIPLISFPGKASCNNAKKSFVKWSFSRDIVFSE